MEKNERIYYGFDFLKFLMALLIVATHSQLFVEYEDVYHVATIIYTSAVPTFFAISTYLYAKKLYKTSSSIEAWKICRKDIWRLCLLGLFWFIVDMPMAWDTFFSLANWKETIASLLILDPVRGLWFIKALIINKIILFFFRNYLKELSVISLIIFVLFSLGYTPILNGFSHYLHPYFSFYFHTFFCCIGALYVNMIKPNKFLTFAFFVFFVLAFICYLYVDDAVILWRIICPFFFISFFMHFAETKNMLKPIFIFLRKISILFYFLHFNLLWFYSNVFCLEKYQFFNYSIVRYIVVLCGCFLLSVLILCLEKKSKLSFLRLSH